MISATSNYLAALAAYKAGPIIYRLSLTQLDGTAYPKVFTNIYNGVDYDWIEEGGVSDLSITINDLDGAMSQATFSIAVSDIDNQITADFPSYTFEGMTATLSTGFLGLDVSDYCTIFSGYVDSVDSANSNETYIFNLADMTEKLSQSVYLTGDNGGPTSSDNIKTLSGHPIDIMLDILQNQIGGVASGGFGSGGYTSAQIDVAGLQAYRDGPFAGIQFLFHLTSPVAALDFISKQLLVPLGGYLWAGAGGVVTAQFFYPLNGATSVGSFTPDTWVKTPEAQQVGPSASRQMVNTVQISFDKDDAASESSGNYLSVALEEYGPSINLYNQYGEHTINADGLRSAFQGFFISAMTGRLIFSRYGLKNLMFDENSADSVWSTILYESGDVVQVTHPHIPDRKNGVMGITNKLFVILDKNINFTDGTTTFTMLDADYLSRFGFYKIAPSYNASIGTTPIPDYASASTLQKGEYMFFCGDNGEYSNGDTGHQLG